MHFGIFSFIYHFLMEHFYFLSEPPLTFDLQSHQLKGFVKVCFIVVLHGLCFSRSIFISTNSAASLWASALHRQSIMKQI